MARKVLFVDDDKEMLLALKEGLERYHDSFSILLAEDGMDAVEMLGEHSVSVLVTDLKMPRMDGFQLLAHVMGHFPEVPVIIITGYSTPEMKRLAKEGGAVGYISKPFLIEDLAHLVMKTIRKESEGGVLHSINSGMFLQLMEMEEKTCTIRLSDKATGQEGVLFFRSGQLLDARQGRRSGLEAAYEILSWDKVTLSIQNGCPDVAKRINSDLQAVILEAARRNDEAENDIEDSVEVDVLPDLDLSPPTAPSSRPDGLRDVLVREVGERSGLEGVHVDPSMDEMAYKATLLANLYHFGRLKAAYIDTGGETDQILVPGEQTVVLSVNPKCPRDKIMRVLGDYLG